MRIGLLNNLRAGRNETRVHRLLGYLRHHPQVTHVETSSAAAVPEALSELARNEVGLLVINGGDGTLQHALTEILGHGEFDGQVPLLAVLRGGCTNMAALDLGMRRDSIRAMASLVEAARGDRIHERIVERRVLRVRYGPGHASRYGMFFGGGVIPRGIELVHRVFPAGRSQGVLGASLVTGALLARSALLGDTHGLLAPDKVRILLDGWPAERGESRLVMATTLDRLFLRMRPFWGGGPGGVRFTALAADAKRLKRTLPGILRGRPGLLATERNGYTSRNAKRVDLELSCGFTVDGELVEPRPGRILSITAENTVRFVRA
jgi:hypothetical protein